MKLLIRQRDESGSHDKKIECEKFKILGDIVTLYGKNNSVIIRDVVFNLRMGED